MTLSGHSTLQVDVFIIIVRFCDRCVASAAEAGDIRAIDDILAQGADMNERDFMGQTPIMYAALMGQTDIVHELLEAKADPTIVDNMGRSTLMMAARGGMIGVVDELILE